VHLNIIELGAFFEEIIKRLKLEETLKKFPLLAGLHFGSPGGAPLQYAAAPVAAPAPAAAPTAPSATPPIAEAPAPASGPKLFSVKLVGFEEGAKIKVLKEIRVLKPGMQLMESKNMVENLPQTLREGAPEDEAKKWQEKLVAAGGKVEVTPQ